MLKKAHSLIEDYNNKLVAKTTTAQKTVDYYLEKIKDNDHLRAVIEINSNAQKDAALIDKMQVLPAPLRGFPILIKDNINTADGTATSAGSLSLANNIVTKDAPFVQLLRQGGAVILGKANMTEFANYMVDYREVQVMPSGFSSRGGQCVHPVDSTADPSGSSTGSAVAVAAGLAPVAIGSETYGSIVSPAQRCGIVGIKPTAGSIDTSGVIPISSTLDIVGPMATSVKDAAIVLGILLQKHFEIVPQTTGRVGVYKNEGWRITQEWLDANQGILGKMKSNGMEVINLPHDPINESFVFEIMRYEFKASLNQYLSEHASKNAAVRSLAEIIEFNRANSQRALKYGQGNLIAANNISDAWQEEPIYKKAIVDRNDAISRLDSFFIENNLDIVLMESAHVGLAAATGFPSITFPIGKTSKNLPIGCCLIAQRGKEDILINIAAALY